MNKTTTLISIALVALIQCAFSSTIVNFAAKSDSYDTTVAVKKSLESIKEHTSGTFLNDITRNNCVNIEYKIVDIETKKHLEQVSSNCCIITFNNTHLLKSHYTDYIVLSNNSEIDAIKQKI